MKEKPTESREGVKGGDFVPFHLPLAGSRDSVPCGVWGNAPTVARQTYSKEEDKQSRGSEASRAQTSRVLRRAPKLLYSPSMLCRARWARPRCWACDYSCSFPQAGFSPLRRRGGGFAVAPSTPSQHTLPCGLTFAAAGENRARDRSPRALWGAKSVLLMQSLAVLRRKERQLDVFEAFLHPMRLAKQGNMM